VIALALAAFLLGRVISRLEDPQAGKADARE